jgi:hypothetical protein
MWSFFDWLNRLKVRLSLGLRSAQLSHRLRFLGKKAASLFLAQTVTWFGESRRLWIGRRIKIFGEFCSAKSTIEALSFEARSELVRIEVQSFANCSLKVVNWPASLAFVHGSSFESATIDALKFECYFSKISEAI